MRIIRTLSWRARVAALTVCALCVPLALAAAGGGAAYHGSLARSEVPSPIVDLVPTPGGQGYWLVAADGSLFPFGDARSHGSAAAIALNQPIVGMTATRTGRGYWLAAADGGVFTFGDARFFGSAGGAPLNAPIVGIAATRTGRGYWLAAADGGVFSFGDARFHGSMGGVALNAPIVGMAASRGGRGYWLVAADGGVFAFGDARFHGAASGTPLVAPISGIAATRDGAGYWIVAEDGGVFAFGDAPFLGSATATVPQAAIDIAPSVGGGYWIATAFGAVHAATAQGVFLADPNLVARDRSERVAFELVDRINAERAARGLPPLRWHPTLGDLALGWAAALAYSDTFAHQDLMAALEKHADEFTYLSENLYLGTGAAADSGSAHATLMRSDGHRSAMLTPELEYVGVGVACVGDKMIVVEDFGVGVGRPAPDGSYAAPPSPFVSADEAGSGCM